MTKLRKAWADFKAVDSGSGGFEGYASLFGVKDLGGDIVEKGAFADSLAQFVQRGFIPVGHEWEGLPIGYIDEAHEDEKGLFVRVAYHSTPEAQAARTVASERMAAGKFVGLSIGYVVPAGGAMMKSDGRHLTKVDLYEVSQVNAPMLPQAGLTAVKSTALPSHATKGAEDGSYEQLIDRLNDALQETLQSGFTSRWGWVHLTYPDYFIALVLDPNDYDDCTYWAIPYTLDADGMPLLGTPSELEMVFVPAEQSAGTMSATYAAQGDRVLATLKGFVNRTQALAAVRAKDGRDLSNGHRVRLSALADQMRDVLTGLDGLATASAPKPESTPDTSGPDMDALHARLLSLRLAQLTGGTPQ